MFSYSFILVPRKQLYLQDHMTSACFPCLLQPPAQTHSPLNTQWFMSAAGVQPQRQISVWALSLITSLSWLSVTDSCSAAHLYTEQWVMLSVQFAAQHEDFVLLSHNVSAWTAWNLKSVQQTSSVCFVHRGRTACAASAERWFIIINRVCGLVWFAVITH